jgi:hypothetical protein
MSIVKQKLNDQFQDDMIAHARYMRCFVKLCDSLTIDEMANLTEQEAMDWIQARIYDHSSSLDSPVSPMATSPSFESYTPSERWADTTTHESMASISHLSLAPSPTVFSNTRYPPQRWPQDYPKETQSVNTANVVGNMIRAPFQLVYNGISTTAQLASTAVDTTLDTASKTVSASYHLATSAATATKNAVTDTLNKATCTAYNISKGCVDTVTSSAESAHKLASQVTTSSVNRIKHLKHTTEHTVDEALNYLPSVIESPIRTLCAVLPIPLSIPAKKGRLYLLHVGAGLLIFMLFIYR